MRFIVMSFLSFSVFGLFVCVPVTVCAAGSGGQTGVGRDTFLQVIGKSDTSL
jgi:hypothetical protein